MKVGRQSKIIELILKYDIETQEELADYLTQSGYRVTQATISRDIRELKLTKISTDEGCQKYIVLKKQEIGLSEKYIRVLKDGFLSMEIAENIIVIKTVSGMAMAVAAAIDALHIEGIAGCIAGDDTIMGIVRSKEGASHAMENLSRLAKGKELS